MGLPTQSHEEEEYCCRRYSSGRFFHQARRSQSHCGPIPETLRQRQGETEDERYSFRPNYRADGVGVGRFLVLGKLVDEGPLLFCTASAPRVGKSVYLGIHGSKMAHFIKDSSTAPPPVVPSHPQFFPPPAQMHGFGMVPNFYTMPSMYHHNGGLRNMDRHGYYASTPASNMLGLSGFRSLPQAAIQAEPPVSDSPPTHSSNSAGDPTTTASSSMGEVPTPESEVKPPTQPLAESSGLICEKLFGDYYDGSGWEGNPAFNPDFDPFTMGGYP